MKFTKKKEGKLFFWLLIALAAITVISGCAGKTSKNNDTGSAAADGPFAELVAAAKAEGKVVVYGPPGDEVRLALTAPFEEKYGIKVTYTGGRTDELFARLQVEHEAGVVSGDVMIGGINTVYNMYLKEMLRPLKPELKDPNVLVENNYYQGKFQFIDPKQEYITRISQSVMSLVVNTDLVGPDDIKSAKDLLDPKWQGKIGISDPRVGGSGNQMATIYLQKHGEDLVKQLYVDQKPEITRNIKDLGDNLVRGKYAIAIGLDQNTLVDLRSVGMTNYRMLQDIEELTFVTSGYGTASILKGSPNSNAGALYANWLLSDEGQTQLSKVLLASPIRHDVPLAEGISEYVRPADNVSYLRSDTLEYVEFALKARDFFQKLLN